MMHQGPFRPGCIHWDIGERCDAAIWENLRSRLASLQGAAAKNKRKSQDGAGAAHGLAFVREAFERVHAQDMEGLAAFCCRHRRMCPVLASNSSGSPSPSPGAAGARNGSGSAAAAAKPYVFHIAGFSCYDWSATGGRKSWLGDSTLPFAPWLAEPVAPQSVAEDIVLAECTSQFSLMWIHLRS